MTSWHPEPTKCIEAVKAAHTSTETLRAIEWVGGYLLFLKAPFAIFTFGAHDLTNFRFDLYAIGRDAMLSIVLRDNLRALSCQT